MKTALRNSISTGLIATASTVFAASGAENEGSGFLLALFLSFGALIIVFQLLPGIVLFVSMIKGLFSAPAKEATVPADKGPHSA